MARHFPPVRRSANLPVPPRPNKSRRRARTPVSFSRRSPKRGPATSALRVKAPCSSPCPSLTLPSPAPGGSGVRPIIFACPPPPPLNLRRCSRDLLSSVSLAALNAGARVHFWLRLSCCRRHQRTAEKHSQHRHNRAGK